MKSTGISTTALLIVFGGLIIAMTFFAIPSVRPGPAFVRESYADYSAAVGGAMLDTERPAFSVGPADATIEDPRTSYTLLNDVFRPKATGTPLTSMTSEGCSTDDYWKRGHEMTGNYRQETNNYRRTYPDDCSAPRHELILDFYESTPQAWSAPPKY